jgi:hypothetical protein
MSSSRRFTAPPGGRGTADANLSHRARRLAFAAACCHIQVNPLPDLAPEEYAELARLVRAAIDGDRYPLSPRVRRLKDILTRLDPKSAPRVVTPFPAPRRRARQAFC